jgi:hypothetical protein
MSRAAFNHTLGKITPLVAPKAAAAFMCHPDTPAVHTEEALLIFCYWVNVGKSQVVRNKTGRGKSTIDKWVRT